MEPKTFTIIEITDPLISVMQACEVRCEVGCCGMEAFDVSPQWIRAWLEKNDHSLLDIARQQVDGIIERLASIEGDVEIPYFDSRGKPEGWIPTFNEFREAIAKAPTSPLPEPRAIPPKEDNSIKEMLYLFGCGVLGAIPVAALIFLARWLLAKIGLNI